MFIPRAGKPIAQSEVGPLLVPAMAYLLLDDDPPRTQRRKQGYRLDKLVLKHAPMELRRWEIEVGLCRVTDVEDFRRG